MAKSRRAYTGHFFLLQLILLTTGCTGSIASSTQSVSEPLASVSSSSTAAKTIDAGMFLVGQPSHLCYPLDRLGLLENNAITSVTSSCPCVRPSVIIYISSSNKTKTAIRLDIVGDEHGVDGSLASALLGVEVKIRTENGAESTFVFCFAHVRGLE